MFYVYALWKSVDTFAIVQKFLSFNVLLLEISEVIFFSIAILCRFRQSKYPIATGFQSL